MLFYASLLNTQYHKVWIKGKCSNWGKGVVPPHLGIVVTEKRAFRSPSTMVGQLTNYIYIYIYIYTHTHTHTHSHKHKFQFVYLFGFMAYQPL